MSSDHPNHRTLRDGPQHLGVAGNPRYRHGTATKFREEWLASGCGWDVAEIDSWADAVREGGLMAWPDGRLLVLVDADPEAGR